jgi:hypothetical protein
MMMIMMTISIAVLGNKHIILSDSTDIRDTTNRALVVSSPPTHHWKGFFKSKGVVRYSLPSWTFKELRSACVGLKKDIIEMKKRYVYAYHINHINR